MDNIEKTSLDTRKFKRKAYHTHAELIIPSRQPIPARTLDLSLGGMGLITGVNLLPLNNCLIRFAIPVKPENKLHLEIQARVVHSVFSSGTRRAKIKQNSNCSHISRDGIGAFKVGIEFAGLSKEAAAAIIQFLNGQS